MMGQGVHVGRVIQISIAPTFFGSIHGYISLLHQGNTIHAIVWIDTDANARGYVKFLVIAINRILKYLSDFLGDIAGIASVFNIRKQDHKLVSAYPSDGVFSPYAALQPFGNGTQNLISK